PIFIYTSPPRPRRTPCPYTTLFRSQVHLARAPGAARLDPGAGPLLVMGLGVLELDEVALALHQAEAARIDVLESAVRDLRRVAQDRKCTRLNSSHVKISYAVFCLKK